MPNLLPCVVICSYDTLNCGLGPSNTLWVFSNNEHMLFILIVRLGGNVLFLGVAATD
jgi:hypothetical protein